MSLFDAIRLCIISFNCIKDALHANKAILNFVQIIGLKKMITNYFIRNISHTKKRTKGFEGHHSFIYSTLTSQKGSNVYIIGVINLQCWLTITRTLFEYKIHEKNGFDERAGRTKNQGNRSPLSGSGELKNLHLSIKISQTFLGVASDILGCLQ